MSIYKAFTQQCEGKEEKEVSEVLVKQERNREDLNTKDQGSVMYVPTENDARRRR